MDIYLQYLIVEIGLTIVEISYFLPKVDCFVGVVVVVSRYEIVQ